MTKPLSLIFLTLLSGWVCLLFVIDSLDSVLSWMHILRLDIAFKVLSFYLFIYWVVIEVKNSYLEWKYMEDS